MEPGRSCISPELTGTFCAKPIGSSKQISSRARWRQRLTRNLPVTGDTRPTLSWRLLIARAGQSRGPVFTQADLVIEGSVRRCRNGLFA